MNTITYAKPKVLIVLLIFCFSYVTSCNVFALDRLIINIEAFYIFICEPLTRYNVFLVISLSCGMKVDIRTVMLTLSLLFTLSFNYYKLYIYKLIAMFCLL